MSALLRSLTDADLAARRGGAVDPETQAQAKVIVDAVRAEGAAAVRRYAEAFNERGPGAPLVLGPDAMEKALWRIPEQDRGVLERTAARIERFARAQRATLADINIAVPGGRAGHTVQPIANAGCYAPAGRHPLPSSLLMTGVTARAAGCPRVVVATPNPSDVMLAAAAVAEVDAVLAVGGAHAIAALAYGFEEAGETFAPCDVIVGPGNRWVTAAKTLVYGAVNIDMPAGPSELVVLADAAADPALVAADLLAQAEHDVDAVPILVTTSDALVTDVEAALDGQLATLDTAETARGALANGGVLRASGLDAALDFCARLAPEHLELHVADAATVAARARCAGAVFVGAKGGEVLGDYGVGPNHTLPTGGAARAWSGLSVMNFVRLQTWLRIEETDTALLADVERLAAIEGLSAHEAAARLRRKKSSAQDDRMLQVRTE